VRIVSSRAAVVWWAEWMDLSRRSFCDSSRKHRHGHAARPLPPTATLDKRDQTLGLFKTIETDKLCPQEHETPQTTTTIGLQFIDHLKSAKDKT